MAQFRIKGWHVLAGVLAFFAVVIAANIVFMTLALRSFPGQEEEKPYLQGLNYNDALADRRRQEALGWRAVVEEAARREDNAGLVALSFEDRTGAPLDGLEVTGALERPASEAAHPVEFVHTSAGRYEVVIEELGAGVWDLSARAVDDAGQRFDVKARIVIE
ncbi:MAG: FixH family protein [Parvularculaceae bacterium]